MRVRPVLDRRKLEYASPLLIKSDKITYAINRFLPLSPSINFPRDFFFEGTANISGPTKPQHNNNNHL